MTRNKWLDLEPLPFTPRIRMSNDDREAAFKRAEIAADSFRDFVHVPPELVARSKEMDDFCRARFDKGLTWNSEGALHLMGDDAAWAQLSPACKAKLEGPSYVLARFGAPAIAIATAQSRSEPRARARLTEIVVSVETATMVAEWLGGDLRSEDAKRAQREAVAYFNRNAKLAAIVLVPMATSSSAKRRKLGQRGLEGLADEHMPTVLSIANAYGSDARAAVDAILERVTA